MELPWWPSPTRTACSEVEEGLDVWAPRVSGLRKEDQGYESHFASSFQRGRVIWRAT
jgi:hypothetical protein